MALSFLFWSDLSKQKIEQIDLHFAPSAIFTHVSQKNSFIPVHQDGYLFKGKDDGPIYQFGMIKQMIDNFILNIDRSSRLLIVMHDFELECDPVSDLTLELINLELEEIGIGPYMTVSSEILSKFKRNKQPHWKK